MPPLLKTSPKREKLNHLRTYLIFACVFLKNRQPKNIGVLGTSGGFDEFGYDRAVLLATLDVAIDHAELMKPSDGDSETI